MYIFHVTMAVDADKELLKDYFSAHKLAVHGIGLSVSPNVGIVYKCFSYTVLFLMVVYTLLMLPDLFMHREDIDELIDSWLYATGFFVVMIETLTLFLNKSKVNDILNTLQTGIFGLHPKWTGEYEQNLVIDCVTTTRKLTIVGSCMGLGTMLASATGAYLLFLKTGSTKLPFGSVSILENYWSFEMILFYHSFVYGIGVEALMMVEIIYSSILAHICVQFKILQNFIRRATLISQTVMSEDVPSSPSIDNSEIPYKYLQRTVKDILLHHMAILEVSETVENLFNIPLLAVFFTMSTCFCFIMYQGSQYPFTDLRFVKDFFILVTAMMPLIINCYWGSEVLFECQGVAGACYEVDFVGTDVRFQKDLMLIIRRSQRPIKLTVGKFAPLSLVTMLGVLRTSYSYFMLLRKVNAEI